MITHRSQKPSLMAVGAHADDIENECGGTLLKAMLFWKEYFTKFGLASARWQTFVDTSPYLDRKMALIGKHACQMPNAHLPDFGHRVLAQEWGKANGCLAAECYDWCRKPDVPQADSSPVFGSITNELLRRTN